MIAFCKQIALGIPSVILFVYPSKCWVKLCSFFGDRNQFKKLSYKTATINALKVAANALIH